MTTADRPTVTDNARTESIPHRDELAQAVMEAAVPFRGPGGQTAPYVMPVHYAIADAVLARFFTRQAQAEAYQRGVDDWADEQGRTVPNPYAVPEEEL